MAKSPKTRNVRPSEVFVRRLRETREDRSYSLSELAQLATAGGQELSKLALLRIEQGKRTLKLDEALALTIVLDASLPNMLTPPPGELLALTNDDLVNGGALRRWLDTGNAAAIWPEKPKADDVGLLDTLLSEHLLRYARLLGDAMRQDDREGRANALRAILQVVRRYSAAMEAVERDAKSKEENDAR